MNNIAVIVIVSVIVVAGIVWSIWFENGGRRKNSEEDDKDNIDKDKP